jgi:hypothetical protein
MWLVSKPRFLEQKASVRPLDHNLTFVCLKGANFCHLLQCSVTWHCTPACAYELRLVIGITSGCFTSKVTVNLSLCLTKHHAMKMCVGVEV